jgi:hypothetical protein
VKVKTIMAIQAREALKYETAIKMRQLLDDAAKAFGAAWEEQAVEEEISELVFGPDLTEDDD